MITSYELRLDKNHLFPHQITVYLPCIHGDYRRAWVKKPSMKDLINGTEPHIVLLYPIFFDANCVLVWLQWIIFEYDYPLLQPTHTPISH
jgi:hypothetical protein